MCLNSGAFKPVGECSACAFELSEALWQGCNSTALNLILMYATDSGPGILTLFTDFAFTFRILSNHMHGRE